jgi:glycosyltransferase involved in cell wall biosynthesis
MAVVKHSVKKSNRSISCCSTATVLIAMPVFNEFKYVEEILGAVQEYSSDILVVDDGSTDGTTKLLERHTTISIISHKVNAGYGRSLIDAFEFAWRNYFDWVITIDCDHQHEPSYIPHFYSEIENDDADIISGSRYLRQASSDLSAVPAERITINKEITDLLNHSLGLKLTDTFCGFKAYRTSAILKLTLSEEGYGLPLQLWIQAGRMGLRIREIPVPLIYHDPKRNFGGVLEDPRVRLAYYMEIIERELGHNADEDA